MKRKMDGWNRGFGMAIALGVSLMAAGTLWAAGTPDAGTGSAASGSAANVNPAGVLPVVKQPITLTVCLPQSPEVKDYVDNDQTRWYTEKTGINFTFQLLPMKDAVQKMQIMIASGGDLPDVLVNFGFSNVDVLRYGSQKAFVPLNKYVDAYGFWIKKAFEQSGEKNLKAQITSADGNIYALPRYIESTPNEWSNRTWIYKPWLDKLGLSVPQTTEEFYQVMKAFKTMDPNGNGKADEIPYAGSTNGWRQQAYDFLFNSFIYNNPPNLLNLNGDKLAAAYVQDEWRDALRYMAKLSKEGLLSPMSFTQDQAQLKQMAETPDNVVLGSFPAGSLTAILNPTSARLLEYVPVPPLKGPKGTAWSTFYPSIPVNAFYITKSNKNPEASFRWGDFMFSEEAPYRHRFGVPGRDWELPKPGELSMFGDQASIKPILNWGAVQNAHWQETTAGYRPYKITDGQVWDGNPKSNQYILVQASKKHYMNKAPAKVVYPFNMTLDEAEEINEVMNTINTYVKEAVARFITGDMNIETDWENYKRELDKMGFKRYMEISQIAYDRMTKGK